MGKDITGLIAKRLGNGESPEAVRTALAEKGIGQRDIDFGFYQYTVRQRLSTYVAQLLSQGYPVEEITSHLRMSGYAEADIIAVTHPVKHGLTLSRLQVTIAVIALIAIAGLIYWFTRSEVLLDYQLKPASKFVNVGEDLEFRYTLQNFGSRRRYDVKLEHVIRSMETDEIVDTASETVAVETQVSKDIMIRLPEDLDPGKYVLISRAVYDAKSPEASFIFTIAPSPPPNTTPSHNVTTTVAVNNSVPTKPMYVNKSANSTVKPVQPPDEIDQINLKLRSADVGQAEAVCSAEQGLLYRDYCYDKVATTLNKPEFCSKIGDDEKRDFCYVTVAINTQDKTLCDRIGKTYVRASCMSM